MTPHALTRVPPANARPAAPSEANVVVLMNFVPPHRVPILSELARRVKKLTVLLSTAMEPNRSWLAEWGDLDVRLQRTISWRYPWRHSTGFTEEAHRHLPWDTLAHLRSLAPDVVISGQLGPRSVLSAVYKTVARTPRLIFWVGMSEHTELGRGRVYTYYRKRLLRLAHTVIINGCSGVHYLESLGVDPARIFRCPYATTLDFFERGSDFRAPEFAHKLLFVGQLVERKGLLPFLEVLRGWAERHPDRRIEFDVVGKGPLERHIRDVRMPGNVRHRLRGSLRFEELPDAYANAGILVFPTLADDWGMVVNEALAAGVPVLGSRYAQAVDDLCVDGINGWTFRPDAGNEMETALDAALAVSAEKLNEMRRAARERVANLTPQSAADILCEAVQHALRQ